jgi:outer membrane protein assembly factor BamB
MKPMKIARAKALVVALCLTGAPALAAQKLPVPVHPDTLPTLIKAWSLPASLAPYVTNAYAPRAALAGALLYTYDHHGRRLVAAKAGSGKVVWHAPVPARSDRAFAFTPFVYDDRVYVASDGYLFGFDALKGDKKLEIHLKGPAINGMARAKHRLFLPWVRVKGRTVQPGVQLWGIDSRSGRVEWAKKLPGSLAYVEGNADGAYYIGDTGIVLGLTPDRGQAKWQLRVEGQVSQPPILHQQHLYVVTRLRKTGWQGSGLSCIDVRKGKLKWKTKIAGKRVATALYGDRVVSVDQRGRLTVHDGKGKAAAKVMLSFGEPPTTLHAAVVAKRAYVFTSDPSGHGYIWLVDLAGKRLIATANAMDMRARSMVPAAKMVFLDSSAGDIHAYRLDRSMRPKRRTVPASEFAAELIDRARRGLGSRRGLSEKLAGLGSQALPAIEAALGEQSPHLVSAAARAVALLAKRRSVPALLKALSRLSAASGGGAGDPLLAVVDALARIRDGRAIGPLQKVMENATLGHLRRRAACLSRRAGLQRRSLARLAAQEDLDRRPGQVGGAPRGLALALPRRLQRRLDRTQ